MDPSGGASCASNADSSRANVWIRSVRCSCVIAQRAMSDNPPCCLLCHAVTMAPALIGFARRVALETVARSGEFPALFLEPDHAGA
jgi:hypothetical protein